MRDATILVEVLSPDDGGDGIFQLRLSATNGEFAAAQEFWGYSDTLQEFGRELIAFPSKPKDSAQFQIGSKEGNVAYYLHLRAYLFDSAGHAAIEFSVDNNRRESRYLARAAFQIHCEVAAINRLGQKFRDWSATDGTPLVWKAIDNKL